MNIPKTEKIVNRLDCTYKGLIVFIAIWILIAVSHSLMDSHTILKNQADIKAHISMVESNQLVIFNNQGKINRFQSNVNSSVQSQIDRK
jgi:hypothetical protein